MNVPMLDLVRQYAAIEEEVRGALDRVLRRQRFILGEEVAALEGELAAFTGAGAVIGVSSGTDAILVTLMALGIGPGDEVLTTPFTFASTVEGIVRLGATPRYVDLAPGAFAPHLDAWRAAIGPRTRALLYVHLYGSCADLTELEATCAAAKLPLVEDAAQGVGARSQGRMAGTFGAAGALSFFPSKTLGAYGDGGAVLVHDLALGQRIRALRNHGQETKYAARFVGGNFRLDEIQAAVLRVKLRHLPRWLDRRRRNAAWLTQGLEGASPELVLPQIVAREEHAFHQYVVRTPRREALRCFLAERGVATEIYYPSPMHRQEAWAAAVDLPEADRACAESLALPVHPELDDAQLATVVREVRGFFGA